MKMVVPLLLVMLGMLVFGNTVLARPFVPGVHFADPHYAIDLTKRLVPQKLDLPRIFSPRRAALRPIVFESVAEGQADTFQLTAPPSFNDTNPAALRLAEAKPRRSKLKTILIIGGIAAGIAAGASTVH